MAGLEASFSFQRGDFHLQVELRFPQNHGQCVAIKGPMGAGKSTFFHCVAGLLKPQKGYLRWRAISYMDSAKKLHRPPQQRPIAYLFQEDRIFKHLSIRANLLYAYEAAYKKKQSSIKHPYIKKFFPYLPKAVHRKSLLQADCEEIVELLDLKPLLEKKSSELSGGESRRLALGRTLLSSFTLLLLDEPFHSLSIERSEILIDYLKRRSDISILFSSHQSSLLEKLAKEVVKMDHGIIDCANFTPNSLATRTEKRTEKLEAKTSEPRAKNTYRPN